MRDRESVFSLIWNGDKKIKSIRLSEERRKKIADVTYKNTKNLPKA